MVLAFESSSRVFCGTDSLSAIFVRNRTYPVRWDYSAWNFIFENQTLSLRRKNSLTRFEFYRVLSVRSCDMNCSVAIAESLMYLKSLSRIIFFNPAGMKSDCYLTF